MYTDITNLFMHSYTSQPIYFKHKHIVIRCPFCGDSIKNPSHAHLYIEPSLKVFWCARCYTGGSLSYLLIKIKDRFNIDITQIARYASNYITQAPNKTRPVTIDEEYVKLTKLKQHLQKQSYHQFKDNMSYYFLLKGIVVDDYLLRQLPITMYQVTKQYLQPHTSQLQDSLMQFTIGNRVIYRFDYVSLMNKGIEYTNRRFMNLYLSTGNNYSGLVYSLFHIMPYNFAKKFYENYNIGRKQELIVAEGLTDIVAYIVDNRIIETDLPITCLVLNGKYYDYIKIFDELFDRITILVDNDATHKAFVVSLQLKSDYNLVIPRLLDYRESSLRQRV
mgnify:CR=1 FL=1